MRRFACFDLSKQFEGRNRLDISGNLPKTVASKFINFKSHWTSALRDPSYSLIIYISAIYAYRAICRNVLREKGDDIRTVEI